MVATCAEKLRPLSQHDGYLMILASAARSVEFTTQDEAAAREDEEELIEGATRVLKSLCA
jgi:hypothetical protein